jgi:hypothetical protein
MELLEKVQQHLKLLIMVVLSRIKLLDFDGYINVHLSADKLATLVAQGDIGQNDLDVSKVYALGSVAVSRMVPLLQASEWRSFGDSKAEKYSSWWITSDTFI